MSTGMSEPQGRGPAWPLGTVTVLGAHILDVLGRPVEEIPPGQGSVRLKEIRATAAGTAAGTGVDLAKLGARVLAVGALGLMPFMPTFPWLFGGMFFVGGLLPLFGGAAMKRLGAAKQVQAAELMRSGTRGIGTVSKPQSGQPGASSPWTARDHERRQECPAITFGALHGRAPWA